MKKIIYLATAGMMMAAGANAQRNLGVGTSDWGGMNKLYLNPANIAGGRERIVIGLFSIGVGVENNLGSITAVGGLSSAAKSGNTNDLFSYSKNNTFSLLAPHAELRGPSIMYSINRRHSIAITTGVRGFNQFHNFDRSLFNTIADPSAAYEGDASGNLDLTSKNFNYTTQAWSQIGFSYAAVIVDRAGHKVKVGATGRYLGGLFYIGLKGKNLDAHYHSGYDSLFVNSSDLQFASNLIGTKSALLNGFSGNNNIFSQLISTKQGAGWGGDIGVVYEYTPHEAVAHKNGNKLPYKFKFAASVTDIGSITYKRANNSNANVSGNGYITANGLADNVRNFDDFRAYAKRQGFKADTVAQDTKVYMPTTLVLSGDYHVQNNLYVNATYIGNMANRQNFGSSYYSQLTVTPRYDAKWFSVAVPITYATLSKSMKAGLGLRLAGFYIGSDDMLALVANKQYGFNVYAGAFIPVYKHRQYNDAHAWHRRTADTTDLEPDMEHGGAKDTADDCPDMIELGFRLPQTNIKQSKSTIAVNEIVTETAINNRNPKERRKNTALPVG